MLTTKTHKEGKAPEGDRSHEGHKTTEVNKELLKPAFRNSATNAETIITQIIYSLVPPKIKFVQNAPNEVISLKYAGPHQSTI